MAFIKCSECGNEISDKATTCSNCGCPLKKENTNETLDKINKNFENANSKGTKALVVISCCIIIFVIVLVISLNGGFKEKIDVTGTSMLEYLTILEDYGRDIDFDGITSGANCFTGKQTKTVNSKKYGKVTVEFSYCKSSNSVYIHVYN